VPLGTQRGCALFFEHLAQYSRNSAGNAETLIYQWVRLLLY
jgi:hypothetical protein